MDQIEGIAFLLSPCSRRSPPRPASATRCPRSPLGGPLPRLESGYFSIFGIRHGQKVFNVRTTRPDNRARRSEAQSGPLILCSLTRSVRGLMALSVVLFFGPDPEALRELFISFLFNIADADFHYPAYIWAVRI